VIQHIHFHHCVKLSRWFQIHSCQPLVSVSIGIEFTTNVQTEVRPGEKGKVPASNMFINPKTKVPELTLPTQALVRVKAFGLNRMDLMQREGVYPVPPQAPSTMGVEFSGLIVQLGPGSSESDKAEGEMYSIGDEVFGLAYGGAVSTAQMTQD
jgi:Alcohol dehydrogenase GroES-like domain